ncbi:MAG: archaeal proteasome endopeptidase complex subunit alpha [Nanoarchaeota archaeon]|nr:archaeal proteasome endopeptidase complex subunit alpha [Nanoarchaeota archaeon]
MQPMQHQMMGYDRAITMFSPDGRLLQVEYAKKTVKQGSTAIGMVCQDGVIFVTDKRIVDKFIVAEAVEKIFQIDDNIGATASGILSDARVLVERAQQSAQQHKITYDTEIDVSTIVKEMCSLKQICTQSGGLRPFGVSLLVGGINPDGTPSLFETDPTGIFFQYYVCVIGEGESEVEEIMQKKYSRDITMEDGLKLCVAALNKVIGKEFSIDRIDAALISIKEKKFTKVSKVKLEKLLKEAKKKG